MENKILTKEQFSDLQKFQKSRTDVAVNKWEKFGMLRNLDDSKKRTMAILLENQLQHLKDQKLLTEQSQTQTAASGEGWSNVAMPLVRKVFANLIANEIVSVQPMSLPSGLVFYLDYQFGTTGTNEKDGRTTGESLYGNTTMSGQVSGGYYGGVDYSYTKNFLSGNLGPFATGATESTLVGSQTPNGGVYVSASWADVDYDINFSASVNAAASVVKKIIVPAASMSNVDETWAKSITLSGGTIKAHYRKFTKYDATTSKFTFIVSGALPLPASSDITGSWIRKNTESFRGDFEIPNTGVGTNPIPEMNLVINSKPVVAGTRKLKAKWTPELQQDFAAYHDVDAEKELTNIMGENISLEIDREILDKLLTNGETVNKFFWSKNIGTFVNQNTGTVLTDTGTFYGTQNEWYQTLLETVNFASNMINKKTLRGAANFMVTSPEVCSMLESIQNFRPIMSFGEKETKFSYGIEKAGILSSRWTIYKDPYFQTNKILLGFKGSSFLENGFIYSPYVPLVLTPTVLDPDTLNPVKGIMTRYATTTVRSEFYAAIVVRDMNTPTINKVALPV